MSTDGTLIWTFTIPIIIVVAVSWCYVFPHLTVDLSFFPASTPRGTGLHVFASTSDWFFALFTCRSVFITLVLVLPL